MKVVTEKKAWDNAFEMCNGNLITPLHCNPQTIIPGVGLHGMEIHPTGHGVDV